MRDLLHSIRNGKVLTQDQIERLNTLTPQQLHELILSYNDTVKGLGQFIQELLSSLSIVKNDS
jgi:hypothetical protein